MLFQRLSENTRSYNTSSLFNVKEKSFDIWRYFLFMQLNKSFTKSARVWHIFKLLESSSNKVSYKHVILSTTNRQLEPTKNDY